VPHLREPLPLPQARKGVSRERLPAVQPPCLHLPAVVSRLQKCIVVAALVAAFVMNGVPHWPY
jgi:hypothetical protein